MWARVSTYEGSPDKLDETTAWVTENVLPKLRNVDGYRGVFALADRSTGRSLSITLWESEDALRASEADADRMREDSTEQADGSILGVERFEVTFHDLP